jgi:hypothetical protein
MPADFTPTLDTHQLESFRANGYLSIDAITTQDEIGWLREVYGELVANERAFRLHYESAREGAAPAVIEQIFAPELLCPKLLETTYIANARRLASALLGVDVTTSVYGGLMLIFKPANAGRDTPWHQDEVYWEFPTERCHSVSCWMPLDDVTVESGCMHFLPGSHTRDVLRYRQPPGVEPLVLDEPVDLSGAVACPIPAGGATFHHCRTLHYTPPNTSTSPRRALTTITHGPRTERIPPLVRPWRGES